MKIIHSISILCIAVLSVTISCKTKQNADVAIVIPPVVADTIVVSEVDYILHGTSFGHCRGYCIKEEKYYSDAEELSQVGNDSKSFPLKTLRNKSSQQALDQLVILMDWEIWNALEVRIGCPDCADQGAEYLEISRKGIVKRVTFDANGKLGGLEEILDVLRERKKSQEQDLWDNER